jgi:UDP-glucose 4-epimerase
MKTVIVTGGCGFIGSHLVDKLVNDYTVIVVDNLSSTSHNSFYFNKKAIYYNYDVSDANLVNSVFNKYRPYSVFHLASEVKILESINNPNKTFMSNTVSTKNILEACRQFNTKKIILSSTSAIYGLNNNLPLKETESVNCLNMYSYSKLFSENLCKLYSKTYNIDSVCFRYFNVYGKRQPNSGSYAPLLSIFARQKKENKPLTIVGDGSQTRDYVHVSDVVKANILALNKDNLNGEVINIGTGEAISVLDIAKMISKRYVFIPERVGEVKHSLADNNKAKIILNWQPTKKVINFLKNKEYENCNNQ